MTRGTDKLMKQLKHVTNLQYKLFTKNYGQQMIDILEFPIKLILSPFTIAFDIAGSAPRGFGVPEFISKVSYTSIFAIATLGTWDIALELVKKVICQRDCGICSGWQALRCTMCKGTGQVHYQVKNLALKSGERATAESVAGLQLQLPIIELNWFTCLQLLICIHHYLQRTAPRVKER